jgi:hypothetical protein
MCRIRLNVSGMLQLIISNMVSLNNMDTEEYIEGEYYEDKEYYTNLYPLFQQYVNELLVKRDPSALKIVTSIWPTLYSNYSVYIKSKTKKDTNYIKQMVKLCSLSGESRNIISCLAKAIWTGKFSHTEDTEIDLYCKKIIASTKIHQFKCRSKEDRIASFIKGHNITVHRAVVFLRKTY